MVALLVGSLPLPAPPPADDITAHTRAALVVWAVLVVWAALVVWAVWVVWVVLVVVALVTQVLELAWVLDTVWEVDLVLVDQVEAAATGARLLRVRLTAARVPMNPSPSPQSSPAGARPSAPSVPPSGTSVLPQRAATTPSVPVLRSAATTPVCRSTPASCPHLTIKLP